MKRTKPCQAAREKGLSERLKTPKPFVDIYKFREIQELIDRYLHELHNIGLFRTGNKLAEQEFDFCTSQDTAYWVRTLPLYICQFHLGRDIEGTIHVLRHKGLRKDQKRSIHKYCNQAIPRLIELGEIAFHDAKYDWKTVQKQLAIKSGSVFEFVSEVKNFLDELIRKIG